MGPGRIVRILVHKKVLTNFKIIVIIRYQKKGELKMEDKTIKLFLCECDCKKAISETISNHNIDIEDYTEILTEIKKWIEYIIGD
jgi:hypothetical protein